ncbi:MAG: FISUMP domain-containing protein, partial [Bacteroidota bacterium]
HFGFLWSSTETNTFDAFTRTLGYGSGTVSRITYDKSDGYSVRCIRDVVTTSSHTCGADSVHNPTLNYGSMTDQDGNVYKTIVVGTQEWMAENLRASHYRNGDAIALVNNNTTWQGLNTGATCFYNNDSAANNCPYGKLYNWYAASDVRNLCPAGWHVPSDAEWTTLTTFLGGENVAGGKMKSTGTQYWVSPNTAADNSSGFSGLSGGYRHIYGTFFSIDSFGYCWSSTELNTNNAWYRRLNYNNGSVFRNSNDKTYGFSVRCIRDEVTGQYPAGSVFCNGPTAVVDVTNPATGKIWMDRNLGASQVATVSSDANAYGDLYQWGRGNDGHQCRNSSTTSTLSMSDQPGNASFILLPNAPYDWRSPQNDNLWQGVNGVNNPCPSGYRLPTDVELDAERTSWSSNNAAGAFASPLKLPMAGTRTYSNGSLSNVGSVGNYWSSTVNGTNSNYLGFNSSPAAMNSNFRAYGLSVRCIRDEGTSHTCGADSVHNATLNYGSMTDQDGNVYKTIVIGTQEWMAENLRAKTYRNGVAIPLVTDSAQWAANYNNGTTLPMMCWYNNDSATYACPYGKLYNWYAVTSSNNVCPTGWHVPSDAEWTTLTTFLGGENVAGGKMKSTGTQYWASPNTADNSSGFSGLPGGFRSYDGSFGYIGLNGN